MTQALIIVGVIVFFISAYGAVMIGGHLLEELDRAEPTPEPVDTRGIDGAPIEARLLS